MDAIPKNAANVPEKRHKVLYFFETFRYKIAKSYKPDDLCRNCPIIGSEDLNEIYIKVKRKSIQETVALVKNPPSQKFCANMTAISDIQPIKASEKISDLLVGLFVVNNKV